LSPALPMSDSLLALREELLALGELLPEIRAALNQAPANPELGGSGPLNQRPATWPGPAQLARRGPRASAAPAEYELLLEMVREGYLLHYGRSRLMSDPDPDLALLLGDGLYALGLARLAELGDLVAVGELGDLISLVAQAHVREDTELAESIWRAVAVAVGWGGDGRLRQAKELARLGSAEASAALCQAADARRANVRSHDAPSPEGDNL